MGNAASNPNRHGNDDSRSPSRSSRRPPLTNHSNNPPQPPIPHRSLRTKKKSLELPDLAALALTPNSTYSPDSPQGPYRRPRPSSPIPIPPSAKPNQSGSPRPQTIPSPQYMPDVLVQQAPSTHIPIPQPNQRGRGNPHVRGALQQHNSSTRSFLTRGRQQPMQLFSGRDVPPAFVPEDVKSTIPLGLAKAEEDRDQETGVKPRKRDDGKEPVSVKIVWRGSGKSVVLARAGDDNWVGRQPMEQDDSDGTWFTWVSLMPGTHHIKFIVDDIWRCADDLPTAVDDDGSLANYVAVPLSGNTPPSVIMRSSDPRSQGLYVPPHTPSLWSDNESSSDGTESSAPWTDEVPRQLINAAREEETYLAQGVHSHKPAPDIPPAPLLPRHLDKLILNARPLGPPHTRDTSASRHHRSGDGLRASGGSRARSTRVRSGLGMTSSASTVMKEVAAASAAANGSGSAIPVTTASGTDVTASTSQGRVGVSPGASITMLGAGLADDGSVLPVPSHVTLQHLATSAIRNGVLAVGNTTRYKKKFITVIYYKPT